MDIYCVYYNTAEWLRSVVGRAHAEAALGGAINGPTTWGLIWRKFSPKKSDTYSHTVAASHTLDIYIKAMAH